MAVRNYKDAKGRTRYMVEFQQRGQRVVRRLFPGATRDAARELEAKERQEIFAGIDLGKPREHTLDEALAAWLKDRAIHLKDARKCVQNVQLLARFAAGKSLRQVVEAAGEAVSAWSPTARAGGTSGATGRRKRLSAATINRRLCVLKAAAKHAWKQGWIEDNLSGRITLLPEHNKREVYLTAGQVRSLAGRAPSTKIAAAILIAAYSGLRASELLALQSPRTASDGLIVASSKTGKPRTVPVVPLLRGYLSELPLGLSYWQLHSGFTVAREAAGMPHVRFHDLRHTCASLLAQADVDLFVIGAILGHAGPQTTARYAHLSQQTLKRAMGKLR